VLAVNKDQEILNSIAAHVTVLVHGHGPHGSSERHGAAM